MNNTTVNISPVKLKNYSMYYKLQFKLYNLRVPLPPYQNIRDPPPCANKMHVNVRTAKRGNERAKTLFHASENVLWVYSRV